MSLFSRDHWSVSMPRMRVPQAPAAEIGMALDAATAAPLWLVTPALRPWLRDGASHAHGDQTRGRAQDQGEARVVPADFVMSRDMLRGVKARAERVSAPSRGVYRRAP